MCSLTDLSNGSSAFGSNSSHPTPLQSTPSGFSNNAGPSIEPVVGSITPASSFSAPPSLGSGGTAVAFGNVGISSPSFGDRPSFLSAPSQPSQSVSSPSGFWSTPSQFGSSPCQQKPAFGGGFGYTTPRSQSSPFGGSTSQQTQPALGSKALSSSAVFGAPSQPSLGTSSSPNSGAPNTSAFGAPTSPAFSTETASPFGSQPTSAFGAAFTSPFGSQPTSTFGSRGGFGTSAFGLTVGTPTTHFGQPSSFGTSSTFGQTNSKFGSSLFASTPVSFGPQSCPFGTPITTPSPFGFPGGAFSHPAGGGQQQRSGSKVVAYAPTAETECTNFSGGKQTFENGKYVSISAMPVYKEKSHEELRWEDYQLGCKGNSGFGSTPFATSNQAVSPSGFQSSAFPQSGGSQNSAFGPPSHPVLTHRFGFQSSTVPLPARSVFESATPSGPRWGSNVGSHTTTPNPFSSGYNHTNEPKVETVKSETTQLASRSTHCAEQEDEKKMDKILRDLRKAFDAERERREGKQLDVSSSTHFPEPQDGEDVKKIDKKKMQDLRMAVEVEREVERRVSAKHIAFLTSMLEKLDSLCI